MKLNMVAHMEVDKVADWQQKMADMEMDMVAENKKKGIKHSIHMKHSKTKCIGPKLLGDLHVF